MFSRAAFGRWTAWPLAGGLVAYNTLFLLGFMNFLIGIGLAFLAAAGWIAWRARAPFATIAAAAAIAVILFFVHLFGLIFFALLIGAHELVWLTGAEGRRWPGTAAAIRRLLPDAIVFVAPAWLLLTSTLAGVSGPAMRLPLKNKVGELTYPFLTYFQAPERLLALAVLTLMAGLLLYRRARVSPQAALAGAFLLAAWPFVPHVFKDTGYIDARFPIMMGFLLFAGFSPCNLPRRLAAGLCTAIALVMVLRVAALSAVWSGHDKDLAELRSVIAHVEPGSHVLAADVPNEQLFPYWLQHRRNWVTAAYIKTYYHDAALLIPERHAFWPRALYRAGQAARHRQPGIHRADSPGRRTPRLPRAAHRRPQPSRARRCSLPRRLARQVRLRPGACGRCGGRSRRHTARPPRACRADRVRGTLPRPPAQPGRGAGALTGAVAACMAHTL